MKKVMAVIAFCALVLCGCGHQASKGTIPVSYADAVGEDYHSVVASFEKEGFTNIEFEPVEDLLDASDGDRGLKIEEIEIDGSKDFEAGKKIDLASKIIIKYHAYAKNKVPVSSEASKGTSFEEIEKLFKNSNFFNVQYEQVLDFDKDNIYDKEVEYIAVDGDENYTITEDFAVDTEIVIYYSFIEDTLPILSLEAKGEPYEKIEILFANSKFEVESKVIGDMDGDNAYDDEVEYIEINSTTDYTLEDKYPINSKVVIYHSYIEEKMPITSSEAQGMNYQEVLKLFEGRKFNNITTKTDASDNTEVKETSVEKITINGVENYSTDKKYPYNSEICIYYSIKTYDISIQLECSENWIFNKYDVVAYVSGDEIGKLAHGETKTFKLQLPKGIYDLVLRSAEDGTVEGTTTLNIAADSLLRYAVYCYGDDIKLSHYKQLEVPYTNENGIGKNVDDVVKAFEDAEFDVTKEALNDLAADNLAKSNTVSEIKIDDSDNFSEKSVFYEGTNVVIYYHSGVQIETPISSSEAKGANHKGVVTQFKEAGFLNVTSEKYTESYSGKARNNAVAEVEIDGDTYFCSGEEYSLDSPIVVYYYEINYQKVTVKKMMGDLEANAYNARTYYSGRYVSATGWIHDIDTSGSRFELVSTTDSWDYYGITCEITDNSQKEIIAKLATRKKVTVVGKITLVSDLGYVMDIHGITVN